MVASLELVGETLDGKYRIERKLGQGGMGAVFLATHLGTERPVALKVIMPQFVTNAEFIERFKREAKAAGLLRHPNVVNVTDFGFTRHREEQIAYLVMEYLTGRTLGDMLDERSILPLEFVADIVEQICLAIETAHRQGIIHRDLKPDNIWLEPNGRGNYNVIVLDFGLAKLRAERPPELLERNNQLNTERNNAQLNPALNSVATNLINHGNTETNSVATCIQQVVITDGDDGDVGEKTRVMPADRQQLATEARKAGGLTQAGAVLGTPLYMSPEQCGGGSIDARSDIYSLAVIVYQMLSGETPFKGNFYALLKQHLDDEPPPLKTKRSDIPASVSELLSQAMAKDPLARPASAAAFAGALRARTETGGAILRRAVAVYSEHFSTFMRISLLTNVPLSIVAMLLMLLVPFIKISSREFMIFFMLLVSALTFTYTANRLCFSIILERLRETPLAKIEFREVIDRLQTRLNIAPALDLKTITTTFIAVLRLSFFPVNSDYVLSPIVVILEQKNRRDAMRRSKILSRRLPKVLRAINLFAAMLYLVSFALFFSSAFGIAKALQFDTTSSIIFSNTVALIVLALNVVWLIPPAHIGLAMLYFTAREAGGEEKR